MAAQKQTTFKPPTLAEVRKACDASGYLLEPKVGAACRDAGFDPLLNWRWRDERDNKVREVDVAAHVLLHGEGLMLGVHALIECKRCTAGCVVFGGGLRQYGIDSHMGYMEGHGWGQPSAILFKPGGPGGSPFQDAVGWSRKRWQPAEHVGTQFAKIVSQEKNKTTTWHARHDDLFDSIDGLMHGLVYYRTEAGLVAPGVETPFFNLAALVVVVDGPLYFYSTDRGPRTRVLRRVDRATVLLRTVVGDHRLRFHVDFVQARGIASYMKNLHQDAQAIAEALAPHEAILSESVKHFGHTDRGENRFGA